MSVVDDDRTGPAVDADSPGAGPAPVSTLTRGVGVVLLVGGLLGATAAVVLLLEKLALLADPNYVPSCSIDPVLSCGTVMRTAQAAVFGFPNPVVGVAAFPVLAAVGALLVSGVELPNWCWLALEFGATAGLGFVLWLAGQSLTVIHALCPYCMVVWVCVLAVWWYVTVHNMATGLLGGGALARTLVRRHLVVLAVLVLLGVVAVVSSFPGYFAGAVGL